jgi:hypothetical protein
MNKDEIIKTLRDMAKYPTVTLPRDCEALRAAADLLAQPDQEPVISTWVLREVYFDEDGEPIMHRSPPQRTEQEPHGWYIDGYGAVIGTAEPKSVRVGEWLPWYTTSPHCKPLTETEIRTIRCDIAGTLDVQYVVFARAIEAAHGIKENG